MTKKSERSLLLACMIFVFVCLLLSGGWRLVGSEEGDNLIPVREHASHREVMTSMPAQQPQIGSAAGRNVTPERMHAALMPDRQQLNHHVQSDANGNVIAGRTYMRAVYQAFVLDDGFV